MSLKGLLQKKVELRREAEELQASIEPALAAVRQHMENLEKEIAELLAADLAAIRKLQEKEFGAVNITKDGYKVTQTIPKKVKWDQDQLRGVFQQIQASGDDPFAWMKAEFKVGEKEYNAYPAGIQAVFAPARVVTPGAPVLEFKALEENHVPA